MQANRLLLVAGGNICVLSNDPGCTKILSLYGEDGETGDVLIDSKEYSNGQYYQDAGINDSNERTNGWNMFHQDLLLGLSEHSLKTMNWQRIVDHFVYYHGNYDALWSGFGYAKKWRRNKFNLYGKKRKAIHDFISSIQIDGYVMVVLFGNGNFASGRRGARSAPVKWVKKELMKYYRTYIIDEFRT